MSDFYDENGNWEPVWKKGEDLTILVSNINWDFDSDSDSDIDDLPTSICVIVSLEDYETEYNADEYISDFLSDEYGFCHLGFSTEIIDRQEFDYQAGDIFDKITLAYSEV